MQCLYAFYGIINIMNDKKYPIGTKIRFLHHFDFGKIGTIVGLRSNGKPIIFLPTADKHSIDNYYPTLSDGTKFTWKCSWHEIEPLKNVQLLFSFMH